MRTTLSRLAVLVVLVAALLVPSLSSPATTISTPITLARTIRAGDAGASRFAFPATHVAFSWTGPEKTHVVYRPAFSTALVEPWQRAPQVHGPVAAEREGRHFSAVLSVDRWMGISWRLGGRARDRVTDVTVDYLNTIDGPRREVEIPAVAHASSSPRIVTRAEWGANESIKRTVGSCDRRFFRLQQIFVHHTAGSNYDSNPKATMRAIYWYHVRRQGWCDIGYNFVIGPDGTVFEGRWARRYKPWEQHDAESRDGAVVAGAHVAGYNSGSLGVSMMGNYSQIDLPPAARRSLVELLAWETDRHHLNPRAAHSYRNPETGATRRLRYISGHRDAGSTACPGSLLYAALPKIRDEVVAARGAGRASTMLTLEAATPQVEYGASAGFEGRLTNRAGSGLTGRPIRMYVRQGSGRWKLGPETVTDAEGDFTIELSVARNAKAIAVYPGDTATWGSQSPMSRVSVLPAITIEAEGGTPDTAGISHHPSGTEVVVLSGDVEPGHAGSSVEVRIERMDSEGSYRHLRTRTVTLDRSSAYRYGSGVHEEGGTYRAVATFTGDADHGRARSEPIVFVVDP